MRLKRASSSRPKIATVLGQIFSKLVTCVVRSCIDLADRTCSSAIRDAPTGLSEANECSNCMPSLSPSPYNHSTVNEVTLTH
jgi:hypothetical protein